jgi:aryl-alcohol dehydrogenase-like predicted oxidoreductase
MALGFCRDRGIAVIPWSPLTHGLLTGRLTHDGGGTEHAQTDAFGRKSYARDDDTVIANAVADVAYRARRSRSRGCSRNRWSSRRSSARASYTTLKDAVGTLSITLSADEIRQFEELYRPHLVLGFE